MDWARTLRVDEPTSDSLKEQIAASVLREGVRIEFGAPSAIGRTYALLQGPASVDPAELEVCVPSARWYPDAIIALAIEPAPPDALPVLAQALGGLGAPAGVCGCAAIENELVVEVSPSVTPARLVLTVVDVELRRFSGFRRTRLLTPLTGGALAGIAAAGLQAPEIQPDRILELLLERVDVE